MCPQPLSLAKKMFHFQMIYGDYDMSEDCLRLSIHTPEPDVAASLPVFVFIHGGGFIGGMMVVQLVGQLKCWCHALYLSDLQAQGSRCRVHGWAVGWVVRMAVGRTLNRVVSRAVTLASVVGNSCHQ